MCYPIGMFPVWLCYLLPTARRWPKITFCLIPTVGALIAIVIVELMCWAYESEQSYMGINSRANVLISTNFTDDTVSFWQCIEMTRCGHPRSGGGCS